MRNGKVSTLPKGWQYRCLGECAQFINGRAYSQDELLDSGTPVLRIQNLNGGDRWYYSDLKLPDEKYCEAGDLLYTWSASFGPYRFNGPRSIFHYHIWRVIPGDDLDKDFAFHLLEEITAQVRSAAHGVTMLHMTKGGIEAWQISLPPLSEQRRIAEVLNRVEALRAKRRNTLAQLNTLTQSIFLDLFGDPALNPKRWPKVRLGDQTSKIGSGATPTGGESSYKAKGISLIRSLNVRDGEFSFKDLAFIDNDQAARLSGVVVEKNDVLLNITGASVARVCRAPSSVLPARVNQHVAIIRPKAGLNQVFLEQFLLASQTKKRLLRIGETGATREAITKGQIELFETICPPIKLQRDFARRIFAVENLKVAQRRSLAELDALFASLQRRAFRGEL